MPQPLRLFIGLAILATLTVIPAGAQSSGSGSVARPTVSGAAKRPEPVRSPRPTIRPSAPFGSAALQRELNALLAIATDRGDWGVHIVSLTRGDTLFARGADAPFLPASTMKLYTAAMALERFGPAHQFRTEILTDGPVLPDGTVDGNLYLKGAGDPSLAPRYAQWHDGIRPMDAIADLVVAAGIKHVRGDIIGDASAYDAQRVPNGWHSRYLQASYAARVSALSFNENIAHVVVRPTSSGAEIGFEHPVHGVSIASTVTVRPGSRGATIRVWQDTTTERFRVHGWIGSLSPARTYQVVIERPEQFVAGTFRAAIVERDITVSGGVGVAPAPQGARRVASWASPPLAQLVSTMNGSSNNHFAELIFRNAANTHGGVSSAGAANETLRAFLVSRAGVAPDAVYAADGSGLSILDRVTPRSMVQLLQYAESAPWGPVLKATLPVAGMTETLKTRMRGTAAQGNLRAKTGTTNDVASLGGYVTTQNGEELAFAIIYNGRDLWRAREAIDAMGATLAAFNR